MSRTITILGCGSSGGVPRVGQGWGACDPADPKNRRRRCSILVEQIGEHGTTRVLVDTSPDLRQQLLDQDTDHLDGILLTHQHADHTNGMDDVRPLVIHNRKRIGLYMNASTAAVVRPAFAYIFERLPGSGYPPLLDHHDLQDGREVVIEGPGGAVATVPFELLHGEIPALGFRFGAIAYTPDLNGIPDSSLPHLEGLDLWIVDALRYTPHPSHFALDETLRWIEKLRPRRAVLTNLHTDMDFAKLSRELPTGIVPAYDGLKLDA